MSYCNEEAEMHTIGAMVLESADRLEAVKKLRHDDFYLTEYQTIFKAITSLVEASRPVNERTVLESIGKDDQLIMLGTLRKAVLMSNGIDADHYINKVKDAAVKRKLVAIHNRLGKELEGDKYASEIIHDLQSSCSNILCQNLDKERTLTEVLSSFADGLSYRDWLRLRMEKFRSGELTLEGFQSGYQHLDDAINGFENGTYTIIGASTSTGKTTFLINLIMNVLKNHSDASIAFFTLEMTISQLIHKLIGAYINVTPKRVKNGDLSDEEFQRYLEMEPYLLSKRLIFNNETPANENSIRNNFRRHIHNYGANIMFVDYITKIKSFNKYNSRHLEIDAISATLHDIALEFNVPVIAIAQLSRQIVSRQDKRPLLSDLRESGSLEEHADNILLLHRPKKYNEGLTIDNTEVFIAKNRHDNCLGKLTYAFHQGILVELEPLQKLAQAAMSDEQATVVKYKPMRSHE